MPASTFRPGLLARRFDFPGGYRPDLNRKRASASRRQPAGGGVVVSTVTRRAIHPMAVVFSDPYAGPRWLWRRMRLRSRSSPLTARRAGLAFGGRGSRAGARVSWKRAKFKAAGQLASLAERARASLHERSAYKLAIRRIFFGELLLDV